MRDHLDEIRGKGAELVIVGNGTPFQARAFRDERQLAVPVLVDPGLRAYKAAGLKRGVMATIGPASMVRAVGSFLGGNRQGSTQGDPWQQGGAFVIAPPGEVRYAYVSSGSGDHPPPAELIGALPQAPFQTTP